MGAPLRYFFHRSIFSELDVRTSTRSVAVCGAAWRSGRQSWACKYLRTALLYHRSFCRVGCLEGLRLAASRSHTGRLASVFPADSRLPATETTNGRQTMGCSG